MAENSNMAAIAIGIVVLIIIILLIVWFFWGGTTTTNKWTFVQGVAGSTDTFLADNYKIYNSVNTVPLSLTLTKTATDPTGETFIINNRSGTAVINIVGGLATVSPSNATSPNSVAKGTTATFIWQSATTLLRVSS